MRYVLLSLASLFVAGDACAEASLRKIDGLVIHLKIVALDENGKPRLLAEPVRGTALGETVSFDTGKEVPIKVQLDNGLESIEYVQVGSRLELTCERVIGDSLWCNLATESIQLIEDKDGGFATRTLTLRKRGKVKIGATIRTDPIDLGTDPKTKIRYELLLEERRPGQ